MRAFHVCWPVVPLTLKKIDDELHRLGHDVHVEKGDGYFYFWKGEANDWLDRTVNVAKVSSLTLEQWIGEFYRQEVDEEMMAGKVPDKSPGAKRLKSRA